MSDPVTNVEIEDVLASIRRLVSHEGRSHGAAASEQGAAPSVEEGRLVLTPAQRVVSETDAPEASVEDSAATDTDDAPTEEDATGTDPVDESAESEDVSFASSRDAEDAQEETEVAAAAPASTLVLVSDREAEMSRAAEPIIEPEGDEAAEQVAVDEADASLDTGPELDAEPVPETAIEAASDDTSLAAEDVTEIQWEEDTSESTRASLLATIAELEAAVGNGSQEWEPDGSEMAAPPVDWDALTAPAEADDEGHVADHEADTPEEADEVGPDQDEALASEDIAGSDDVPADMSGETLVSEVADAAVDAAPADLSEQAGSEVDFDDDVDALLGAQLQIDDAMLRDLVADIVREELQGALGERITRNVRKLVRREIYRILASQDFE